MGVHAKAKATHITVFNICSGDDGTTAPGLWLVAATVSPDRDHETDNAQKGETNLIPK